MKVDFRGGYVLSLVAVFLLAGVWWWQKQVAEHESQVAIKAVDETFHAYRNATLADDGLAAASLISKKTTAYFEELRGEIMYADERRLDRLDPVRRMFVLALRSGANTEGVDLGALSPVELIAKAYEYKLIGQDLARPYELASVVVVGDEASARLRIGEQVLERTEFFTRDTNGWRYDLLPVLGAWQDSFVERAEELGVDQSMVVDMTVEAFLRTSLQSKQYMPLETREAVNHN